MKLVARESSRRLIQFLMGLNDSFEGLRNQLLNFDPFPDVSRAYCMAIRTEQEKNAKNVYGSGIFEIGALVTRSSKPTEDWKKKKELKKQYFCEHYHASGHL